MACNTFVIVMILVALLGVSVEGTVHKVGDSIGWTMMGADYESWSSSRTFQVGDSLVFQYNNEEHDVTEVTPQDFQLCDPSKPVTTYQTGFDTIKLTRPGVYNFICGVPGHCDVGQKLEILVLPASFGPVPAPVPRPVRSTDSPPSLAPLAESPVKSATRDHMGPAPAPHSAASYSGAWIKHSFLPILFFFILV